ncbi:MAG: hypothetical protein R3B90_04435 [Planctomycetaceae bacterium]
MLEYVDRVDGQLVVVELEVVNVDQTARDMLVLLVNRGVRVLGDDTPQATAGAGSAANSSAGTSGNAGQKMVAVFVEASDAQLAGVVDELLSQVSVAAPATSDAAADAQGNEPAIDSDFDRRLRHYETVLPSAVRSVVRGQDQTASPAPGRPAADQVPADQPRVQVIPPSPQTPTGAGQSAVAVDPAAVSPAPRNRKATAGAPPIASWADLDLTSGDWSIRLNVTPQAYELLAETESVEAVPAPLAEARTNRPELAVEAASSQPDVSPKMTPPRRRVLFVLQGSPAKQPGRQ